MARCFLVGLLLSALVSGLAPQLGAAPPDPGILRVSTTLPRTLPLHIRSPDGLSILVDVTDAVSGAEVMRAFGKGGAMFRVLLPPGQFRLRIAVGRGCQCRQRRRRAGQSIARRVRRVRSHGHA